MTGSDEASLTMSTTDPAAVGLSPTRRGNVLVLWMLAQVVGMAGTRLINVAVPWFVLVTTRDPALAGVAAFAQMAPMVVAKTLAGPMIDRVGAVRVAVAADLASCVAVAAVPLLNQAGALSWPLLLVIAAAEGTLRGPGDSAKYALCPRLAKATRAPLERVTGLANTVDRVGSAVGAAFGGLVIAAVGAPSALLLSCGTFLLAAIVVGAGVGRLLSAAEACAARSAAADAGAAGRAEAVPSAVPSTEEVPGTALEPDAGPGGTGAPAATSYWKQLCEGFRYWRGDAVLVSITALVALTNLLDQAYLAVLVPEWALRSGNGAEVVGLVFGVYTAAAVAGSAIATAVASRLPTLTACVVAFLLTGPPRYLALASGTQWGLLLGVVVAVSGLASGFLNPIIGAVVFGRIPAPLVGRVSSLQTSLCWAFIPFGGVFGGLLIGAVGGAEALLVCGFLYVVLALVPLVVPAWRRAALPVETA